MGVPVVSSVTPGGFGNAGGRPLPPARLSPANTKVPAVSLFLVVPPFPAPTADALPRTDAAPKPPSATRRRRPTSSVGQPPRERVEA
jgi:hypothetical protein